MWELELDLFQRPGLTQVKIDEFMICAPAGRIIGSEARTIPKSGSRAVHKYKNTTVYVKSLPFRSRQKAIRRTEIMQMLAISQYNIAVNRHKR